MSPVVGGSVRASGARFVDAGSGIAINDIDAEISLGGGVARLTRLTGTLSTGGRLSGSGTVGIDPARGFPADLAVKIVDGRYTDGHVVTAKHERRPVDQGAAGVGADAVWNDQPRQDGDHGSGKTAELAGDTGCQAQECVRCGARAGTGPASGRTIKRRLWRGLMLDVTVNATNQIFVSVAASTPNWAAVCG